MSGRASGSERRHEDVGVDRRVPERVEKVAAPEACLQPFLWHSLPGKVLGFIGMGEIGTEIAKRARAFEMTVQ